jgi:hypothetical protein
MHYQRHYPTPKNSLIYTEELKEASYLETVKRDQTTLTLLLITLYYVRP